MRQSQAVPRQIGASHQKSKILTKACASCVEQCLNVVEELPQELYTQRVASGSSIGTHIRHITERVSCVLDGLPRGLVEYDCRARDRAMEASPGAASDALSKILERLDALGPDCNTRLRVCESVHDEQPSIAVDSTLDRELMGLVSHTIHHLAIIAMLARNAGHPLPDHIGKAPSTLIFEKTGL